MSESSYQTSYGSASPSEAAQGMGVAAADFRRNVQEASERLSNAGSQLVSMSQELAAAIAEAKQAAEQAQAAQKKAEDTQAQMAKDYGAVSGLVRDLQERISALSVLARPLAVEPVVEPPAVANAEAENVEAAPSEAQVEMSAIADPESPEAAHPETQVETPAQPQPQPGQYGYSAPNTGFSQGGGAQSWSTRTW